MFEFNKRSSIYLSFALHAVVFLVCALFLRHAGSPAPAKNITYFEIMPPAADLALKPPAPEKKEEDLENRRLVQTEQGELAKIPAPNAFLGERTQTVDRQTVSRTHTIAMGHEKSQTPKSDAEKKPAASQSKEVAQAELKNDAAFDQKVAITPLQKLGLALLPTPEQQKQIAHEVQADRPQWASDGGNAPQDFIRGLKEGERTALNTREFIFFGYYQRIRERLDRAWVPVLREKLTSHFRSGRQIASATDHTTRVIVILNGRGEVVQVKMTNESGLTPLDDAAVAAFNLAGPFPNPPHGIADRDGEIKIPWEFILHS